MARSQKIKVVVADDHPMFREGVARAIQDRPELELVAEAREGRESVALVERLEPDAAVFDLSMPSLEGMQALRALRASGSTTHVLFLSAYSGGQLVHDALAAGAMGFYSKQAGRQEICDAIVKIVRGEVAVDPRVASGLHGAIRERGQVAFGPALTPRQLEVLKLVSEGRSGPQIAAELFISPQTVRSHVKALFEKLEASSQAEAVAAAYRRGILI